MTDVIENKIIIAVAGRDRHVDYADYGLTFDSTDTEILNAVGPMVHEEFGVDLRDRGEWVYKIHKTRNNQNVYIIPNSTAGCCPAAS